MMSRQRSLTVAAVAALIAIAIGILLSYEIHWFPVEADELLEMREAMAAGQLEVKIEPGEFSLAEHESFLARESDSIATFQRTQRDAFVAERAAWAASGEFG